MAIRCRPRDLDQRVARLSGFVNIVLLKEILWRRHYSAEVSERGRGNGHFQRKGGGHPARNSLLAEAST